MSTKRKYRREIVYADGTQENVFNELAASLGEALDREAKWALGFARKVGVIQISEVDEENP